MRKKDKNKGDPSAQVTCVSEWLHGFADHPSKKHRQVCLSSAAPQSPEQARSKHYLPSFPRLGTLAQGNYCANNFY
jgi:hypothetical protein